MATTGQLLAANLHDVFGNRDPASRTRNSAEVFADEVAFIDPKGETHGRAALLAKVDELLSAAPADSVFVEDGPPYVSETTGALAWALGPAGAPIVRGIDIITVRDGKIIRLETVLRQ